MNRIKSLNSGINHKIMVFVKEILLKIVKL